MRKTTLTFALLATGLLALTGAATPVLADGGGQNHGPRHGDHDGNMTTQHGPRHGNLSAHPHFQHMRQVCADIAADNGTANATTNSSLEDRCAKFEQAQNGSIKARRAAHAIL